MNLDLLVIGAGPAGMAAAITARRNGLDVLVIDEQPSPGGQIWRSVETAGRRDKILGPSFVEGREIALAFRASAAGYEPNSHLIRIDGDLRTWVSRAGEARVIEPKAVLLATGAQERPAPFPGWTLPGVMTVGAAQILLKSAGQVPCEKLWIAGSGPLPLLYLVQLLSAGVKVAGYLDTTPPGQLAAALKHLPRALRASWDLLKGLGWSTKLRWSGIRIVRKVTDIEALGEERIEGLRFTTSEGKVEEVSANTLLVHEGVIPTIHPALSAECAIEWNVAQESYRPVLDGWGESSQPNLFIAGDGAGIAGAKAALLRGELAAIRIASKLGRLDWHAADDAAKPVRRRLSRELAARPFLDALFRPRRSVFAPADKTIVCRCEEITAAQVRAMATIGQPGPNQVKAALRTGMGPCQGRQCGYSIMQILASAQGRQPEDVGFFHIRPPLKPITLGELAAMASATESDTATNLAPTDAKEREAGDGSRKINTI